MLGPFPVSSVMKYTLQVIESLSQKEMGLGGCSQRLRFQEAVVSTHLSSPSQPSFLALTSGPDFAFWFPGDLMSYFLQPPIYLTLDPSLSTSCSPFTHVSVEKLFFF